MQRGSQIGFFGTRDFPYLKLGIRDYKAKSGRVWGLKVCLGGGMVKITLRITELQEIMGRDTGLKYPIGDRTFRKQWSPEVTRAERESEDYRS